MTISEMLTSTSNLLTAKATSTMAMRTAGIAYADNNDMKGDAVEAPRKNAAKETTQNSVEGEAKCDALKISRNKDCSCFATTTLHAQRATRSIPKQLTLHTHEA